MKKFSKITNQKVGQEPVKKETINEEDKFLFTLMGLMDKYLHIQTYGPIDRYLRAGTIKITGKEALAEALSELISDKSTSDKTILLEGLKSTVKDWSAIDEKISQVGNYWTNKKNEKQLLPHKTKILEIINKYGQDEEILLEMINKSAEKIKSQQTANLRAIVAFELGYQNISEIYNKRAEEISNKQ